MVPGVFSFVTSATYVPLLLSLLFSSSIKTYSSYLLSPSLSYSFSQIYNQSFMPFMSYSLYSPTLSPLTSPESTPPPSPLYSIEEPKTLSEQELNAFREAALHIINTHTREEATRIFTEGLIPVDEVKPKTPPKEKKKIPETGDNVKNGNKTP